MCNPINVHIYTCTCSYAHRVTAYITISSIWCVLPGNGNCWKYEPCINTGKVILHPDLSGVPLLILANKQDKFVSHFHLTIYQFYNYKINYLYNVYYTKSCNGIQMKNM